MGLPLEVVGWSQAVLDNLGKVSDDSSKLLLYSLGKVSDVLQSKSDGLGKLLMALGRYPMTLER